jgi:uncharacterized protein YraI
MLSLEHPAQAQGKVLCPGSVPSFILVGQKARVTLTPAGQTAVPVRVRAAAGVANPVIVQIPDGTVFDVTGGPACADNFTWWRISFNGQVGWVAEGSTSGYFIEPLPAQPAGATPTGATPTAAPALPQIVVTNGTTFSTFQAGNVDTSASLTPYQVAPDFSNTIVSAPMPSDDAALLRKNMFAVSPNTYNEFFALYTDAFDSHQPQLITTDSMLHSFHLMFDKVLRTSEDTYFVPLLNVMNAAYLAKADQLYGQLKGSDWEKSALQTVAYFGVATKLLNPDAAVPPYVQSLVTQEIASIQGAAGISPSAVFPDLDNGEDWTQYKPRGHYTKSETLSAYFRTMMYFGRMTFRLKQDTETKAAILVALTVRDSTVAGAPGLAAWSDLYEPTVFFVGHSDDLSITDYLNVINQVYGQNAALSQIQGKDVAPFVTAAKALPSPRIMGAVIYAGQNVDDQTKGMRFMGQRFVWDAYAMGQLVYTHVGTGNSPRTLPMALDVFAALGSDRALSLLDAAGATAFQNYTSQMNKVRGEIGVLKESDWTDTLYNGWLYSLQTLTQPTASGYPSVMTTQAYADRNLYAALGSYAELKHDTILYAKQAGGGGGGGGSSCRPPAPVPPDPPNYVEPVPLFWARLAALAEMTIQGLKSRNLLNAADADALARIALTARHFEQYAIGELHNQALTQDQQTELRGYYKFLEDILAAANRDNPKFDPHMIPPGLVADIAFNPSTGVLEVGTGTIFDIYATFPVNGKLITARGGVYSYYEFQQPLNNRLNDDQWQQMVTTGKTPPLPAWTATFMGHSNVDTNLVKSVYNFATGLIQGLWQDGQIQAQGPEFNYYYKQLNALQAAHQYEGRNQLDVSFVDYKLSADGKTATVTTHETWQGKLYQNTPQNCGVGAQIGQRGPYVITMTYVFTQQSSQNFTYWKLINVSGTDAPAWTK